MQHLLKQLAPSAATRLGTAIALVLILVTAPAASAQQSRRARAAMQNGAAAVEGRYQPAPRGRDIEARILTTRRANGLDLVFELHNGGDETQRLGAIVAGPINLGRNATRLALGAPGRQDEQIAHRAPVSFGVYPRSMYAPVAVIESSEGVFGASLHYPVIERRHEAGVSIRPAEEYAHAWEVVMTFEGAAPGEPRRLGNPGRLAPGETVRYQISVRTAPRGAWRQVLEPYRRYFTNTYGHVAYDRDERPVRGATVAGTWAVSPDNPRGFVRATQRPDRNGWAPFVDALLEQQSTDRVMVWTPSGVFRNQRELNYPFQFTTGWLSDPTRGSRLAEAPTEFQRIRQSGRELGFWWGRSAQVMRGWDQPGFESLDPRNASHRRAGFAELDLAVEAGATMIGLDAFSHHWAPVWDLHEWLGDMQARAPGVRFVTEGLAPDVLHVMAPSCTTAYVPARSREQSFDGRRVRGPFELADFLIPGHETWALQSFNLLERHRGAKLGPNEIQEEIRLLTSYGFVPVAFSSAPMIPGADSHSGEEDDQGSSGRTRRRR